MVAKKTARKSSTRKKAAPKSSARKTVAPKRTAPKASDQYRPARLEAVVRQLAKGNTLAAVARAKAYDYHNLRAALARRGLPTSPGAAILAGNSSG